MENIEYKNIFENEDLKFKKSKFTESQDKLFIEFEKNINYYLYLPKYNPNINDVLSIINKKIKSIKITNNIGLVKYNLINIHNECFAYMLKYMNEIKFNDLFYTKNLYTLIQMEQYALLKKIIKNFNCDFRLPYNIKKYSIKIINKIQNIIVKLLSLTIKTNNEIVKGLFNIILLSSLSLMLYV